MILPTKHTKLSKSLINIGALLLNILDSKYTVTLLWDRTRNLPEINNFERFTLGLDFLFMLGLIEYRDGLIERSGI